MCVCVCVGMCVSVCLCVCVCVVRAFVHACVRAGGWCGGVYSLTEDGPCAFVFGARNNSRCDSPHVFVLHILGSVWGADLVSFRSHFALKMARCR